jgi:putative transposase
MARWKKLAHVVYQFACHIVWCPKYRYKVLRGNVAKFGEHNIRELYEWKRAEVLELSVQEDHVHLVVSVPRRYRFPNYWES